MSTIHTNTPWGPVQQSQLIAEGIVNYMTASHGGICVSAERMEEIPETLKPFMQSNVNKSTKEGWFEEDCEWAFVVTAFPQYFNAEIQDSADATMRNWHPDAWEAFHQKTLSKGESMMKDRQNFNEMHKNDFIVLSAWGSWAEHVPKNKVGVYAVRGGRPAYESNKKPEDGYFLVDEEEYKSANVCDFVIDLSKHQKLDVTLGASRR